MKPTLSYEMHTVYTGALYLKAVMAFRISNIGYWSKYNRGQYFLYKISFEGSTVQ